MTTRNSHTGKPSGVPTMINTRLTPQYWHIRPSPLTSSIAPTERYFPTASGLPITRVRRITSDIQRRPSFNDMNTTYLWHDSSQPQWSTNGTSSWVTVPSANLNSLTHYSVFSSFSSSLQTEFIRSYNRSIQTYRIIASLSPFYHAVDPQTRLTDRLATWVAESRAANATTGDDESALMVHNFESPQNSAQRKAALFSELSQGSTIATALTGSSRTRSPSPENPRHGESGTEFSSSIKPLVSAQSTGSFSEDALCHHLKSDFSQDLSRLVRTRVRSETEFRKSRSFNDFMIALRGPFGIYRGPHGPHCLLHNTLVSIWSPSLFRAINQNPPFVFLRPSRFDVLRAMWIDTATTTIQRYWRGRLGRKRAAAEKQWQKWKREASMSAIAIQRLVRRFLNRLKEEREAMCKAVYKKRQIAAVVIQRYWLEKKRREAKSLEAVIVQLRKLRYESAVAIQRHYRGFKARKLVDLEHRRWVVTWRWDPPGKVVELVGSFTTPPWTRRILMSWDPMARHYVVDLPRIAGRHEIKFVVDGDFCCDGSITVISDGAGHYNNVMHISPPPSEPPLKRLRDRLRFLEVREDPIFVRFADDTKHNNDCSPRSASMRERLKHDSAHESLMKRSISITDTTNENQSPQCQIRRRCLSVGSIPKLLSNHFSSGGPRTFVEISQEYNSDCPPLSSDGTAIYIPRSIGLDRSMQSRDCNSLIYDLPSDDYHEGFDPLRNHYSTAVHLPLVPSLLTSDIDCNTSSKILQRNSHTVHDNTNNHHYYNCHSPDLPPPSLSSIL